MSLYESWLQRAYDEKGQSERRFWDRYVPLEQKIYEYLLENKIELLEGTVDELSKRFGLTDEEVCGFLDGINEANETPVNVQELEEDTPVTITINYEKLYKKMVEFKADHLYVLPQWDNIFTEEERDRLYREQKDSRTVRNANKTGRNEPCPCGSGKKYKKCCGMSA